MELERQWVTYSADGAPVQAYLVRPARAQAPLPGVVVIQEVWGVDAHIQDVTDRFATAGYAAMAPDLYSHGGRPPELEEGAILAVRTFLDTLPPAAWGDVAQREAAIDRLPPDEGSRIRQTLHRIFDPARPMAQYVGDLRAAAAYLRDGPSRGRAVGSVGYCMGGALSVRLAAADERLGAAVIYYGDAPSEEEQARIACPVLGLYGGEDHRITDRVPEFAARMQSLGKAFAHRVYPGAPHAFFNDLRRSYHVDAARDAWARTLAFLADHLA
ncbi:MAG: dienelactone hydrolase family protein [Firmicutes bacterium]|nr:dienelactone hydrolase family protein [Bacillota bacterium]